MKTLPISIVLLVIFSVIFLFNPLKNAQAALPADGSGTAPSQSQAGTAIYTAQSNCVITKVGNPPANQTLPAGCGGGNQDVVAIARKYINSSKYTYISGNPSRNWGSDKNPTNFDCSGFAGWAWYWGTNGKVSMAGQTATDWNDTSGKYQKFLPSQISQIQPGDLIYFSGGDSPKPGHVVMYEGPGVAPATCGANDCVMEFYETGKPGIADSLAQHMKEDHMYGFLRPVIK